MFQVFLRYEKVGVDGWRFSGAYAPHVKYFRPEHRITRFGGKPYLIVTGQGISGSGISSKIESWIDLTRGEFEAVLNFMSEGTYLPFPSGIGRAVRGFVVSLTTEPVQSVTVAFVIKFDIELQIGEKVPIGERKDRVVYIRTGTGEFKLNPGLSTATTKDVEDFYEDLETEVGHAYFLKFNLKGLMALATSENTRGRAWLSEYLHESPDTPESRQLKTLLTPAR